jgi:hypothetical protein
LPFIVGLDQDRAGQPQHRGVIGEDADHVRATLDLLVDPLQRVRAPDLDPVRSREGREGGQVLTGIGQHGRHGRELGGEHGGNLVDLVDDLGAGGLGEDGPDGRGHHLG